MEQLIGCLLRRPSVARQASAPLQTCSNLADRTGSSLSCQSLRTPRIPHTASHRGNVQCRLRFCTCPTLAVVLALCISSASRVCQNSLDERLQSRNTSIPQPASSPRTPAGSGFLQIPACSSLSARFAEAIDCQLPARCLAACSRLVNTRLSTEQACQHVCLV